MTADGFRKLALALPGVEERAHMSHPDFRVGGKIFASLGSPRAGFASVLLTPDDQAAFMAMKPGAFEPASGTWGEQGWTRIVLRHATAPAVRASLAAAHERRQAKSAAPRRRK